MNYAEYVDWRWTVPLNYPVFYKDAFRKETSVHTAAVIKSYRKDTELADLIYSGVRRDSSD